MALTTPTTPAVGFDTGAARGMGIELAQAALDAGLRVIGTVRDATRITAALGEHDNLAVSLDVTDVPITRAPPATASTRLLAQHADHRGPPRSAVSRLDLFRAARTGGKPIACGELGYLVLDTLMAIDEATTEELTVSIESRIDRVPLVADNFDPYAATLDRSSSQQHDQLHQ